MPNPNIETIPKREYPSAFDRIIPEKAMEFGGYYYGKEDVNKTFSMGKEGCTYRLNGDLAVFLTDKIKHSNLSEEVEDKLQSLWQDDQGRQYLSSWHDIDKVIAFFSELPSDKEILNITNTFKNWLEQGIQEISFDWYNKNQGV